MNDRLAFLRAIRANPDDDTTRLVFADWLDEHDDPLGEFIRVQIELEPIRYRIDNPRAVELHRREDELLRAHSDDWLGTDHLLTNPADFGPVCRRGFPDYACLSLDTFLQNGEALFAAHPTLREVALYGLANRCSELTMSPLLAKLDTLEIADWPTEDDAISLSVSPHLDRIGRFKLWLGEEEVPTFLPELAKQVDDRWPREIELIQLFGEGTSGVPSAVGWREHCREQEEQAERLVNQALGRPLVRVTRQFDRLFPLDGNVGYGLFAGRLPDGHPALVAGTFNLWLLVVFDDDGRIVNFIEQENGLHPWQQPIDAVWHATAEWAQDVLRLALGVIWVRQFSVPNLTVSLCLSRFFEPSERDNSEGGRARWWLHSTNFVINWFRDYWADWPDHPFLLSLKRVTHLATSPLRAAAIYPLQC